jgi:hypothetical protein
MSNLEWQRATAEKVLRSQVDAISRSQFPSSDFALGMVEAYYPVDLLDDMRLGYWRETIENAVQVRRRELRNKKHAALVNMPDRDVSYD